jgi:hypothetical protein
MRLQWFGIVFLPAAYLHLSDALLVTAGRPSRGRSRIAVRGMYTLAAGFFPDFACIRIFTRSDRAGW